jgi:hypothetical protein
LARVLKDGGSIGIAEPMCLDVPIPPDLAALDDSGRLGFRHSFRSLAWNRALFAAAGLKVHTARQFEEAREWWLAYAAEGRVSETERRFIAEDGGRWLTLGLVAGQKPFAIGL